MIEEKEIKTKTEYCLSKIKEITPSIENLYQECEEALKFFNGDPSIVDSSKKRSQATTTDFRDAVEWMRPSLLDIFTSGNEVASLEPASEEDVKPIKDYDRLVNYQLKIRNKWYLLIRDFIDDALMFRVGIIKYQWYSETKNIKKSYSGVTTLELDALKRSGANIISVEESPVGINENGILNTTYTVVVQHEIKDSYPLVESTPITEIGFNPNIKYIDEAFVWHKISYCKYDFIKRYGKDKFKKVKDLTKETEDQAENLKRELFKDIGELGFIYDDKEDKYIVCECYYRDEETGTPMITELCGDVELNTYENKYEKPPFIIASILKRSHRLVGSSQYELNKDFQKIRTAMIRQILDNLYFCNNRRYFVDPLKVDMNDYLNKNEPGAAIKTRGGARPSDCAWPEDKAPIPPEIFSFWETILTEKDYHTGIPRSFQGVNPRQLNKTFRGQSQQIEQAAQRIAEAARNMAETAISPLINEIINLNLKFLDKETSFRYLNEVVTVNPDNTIGKYDIIVNVGIGTGDKEKIVTQMEQLLSLFAQTYKVGVPVVNAQDIFNVFKSLISAMGHKNINDYITDPKINSIVMKLIKIIISTGLPQQNPELQGLIQQAMASFGMNIDPNSLGMQGDNPPQGEQPSQPPSPLEGMLQ